MRFCLGRAAAMAILGCALAAAAWAEAPAYVNDCKVCHEKAVTGMQATPHASLADACASCHGDVMPHLTSNLEKGEPGPIVKLSAGAKAADVNKTCLTCHETTHPNWGGSMHERRGLACTSCHSVHSFQSARHQLKDADESAVCYTCHAPMRALAMRTSHHPIREGLMTCGSCHDPHDGSRPKMIRADWTNELCYKCHTEKRGPFFWEHAPVRENCLNCHNPHGSNHDKLLVAQQPWLCQRCHLNTRHPGTLYSNLNAGGTTAAATNRAVEHACKNCHQNVHGGNAPTAPYLGR